MTTTTETKKPAAETAAKQAAKSAGFKDAEDFAAYSKDNLDAALASGAVFAKGVQEFNKAFSELARASMEDAAAAAQRLTACKTTADVFAVQSDFARAGYEKALVEGRKFSDMGVKLAEETAAPLAGRAAAAAEKFSKPLAA